MVTSRRSVVTGGNWNLTPEQIERLQDKVEKAMYEVMVELDGYGVSHKDILKVLEHSAKQMKLYSKFIQQTNYEYYNKYTKQQTKRRTK